MVSSGVSGAVCRISSVRRIDVSSVGAISRSICSIAGDVLPNLEE